MGKLNLKHLRDYRHMSAHPNFDGDFNLNPLTRLAVATHIRNSLDNILFRPAIFIGDILDMLLKDLNEKKLLFLLDYKGFSIYINSQFFDKMPDIMFLQTFKTVWKFVFMLDNIECESNRNINEKLLYIMLETV